MASFTALRMPVAVLRFSSEKKNFGREDHKKLTLLVHLQSLGEPGFPSQYPGIEPEKESP
jgi:hypothetical protein